MEDPARVLTEPARTRWLQDGVRRAAELWHPIGQQIVMTRVLWPGAALGASGATIVNADQWDGYRPAQRDMVDSLCQARADAVVLTGDRSSAVRAGRTPSARSKPAQRMWIATRCSS